MLVAKLAIPVALVVLIVAMFWWGAEHNTGPVPGPGPGPWPCPPWPTATVPFDPADERQLAALITDMSVGLTSCAPPDSVVPRRNPTLTPAPTIPPPGRLFIHKRDGDGNPLDETCFSVTSPSRVQREVCDADDGVNDGETTLWDLPPGTYTVAEISTKPGYVRSPNPQTVIVSSGSVAEVTFVSEPLEGLEGVPVYVYALKCGQDPGPVNGNDVAAGVLPKGCAVAPGVEFIVMDMMAEPLSGIVGEFVTDGSGRLSFRALDGHLLWTDEQNESAWPFVPVLRETTITVSSDLRVVLVHVGGCTVSSDQAQVGAMVSVECSGFQSNEMVTFSWWGEGYTPVATVQATSTGHATATFAVPQSKFGPNIVLAVGDRSGKSAGGIVRI
jgi:hypothetical protein